MSRGATTRYRTLDHIVARAGENVEVVSDAMDGPSQRHLEAKVQLLLWSGLSLLLARSTLGRPPQVTAALLHTAEVRARSSAFDGFLLLDL